MRYPPAKAADFDSLDIFSTEQEKRFAHKTIAKCGKTKMHDARSGSSNQNITAVELYEQNLIPFGGSAASFAREAKGQSTDPQVSFMFRLNFPAKLYFDRCFEESV